MLSAVTVVMNDLRSRSSGGQSVWRTFGPRHGAADLVGGSATRLSPGQAHDPDDEGYVAGGAIGQQRNALKEHPGAIPCRSGAPAGRLLAAAVPDKPAARRVPCHTPGSRLAACRFDLPRNQQITVGVLHSRAPRRRTRSRDSTFMLDFARAIPTHGLPRVNAPKQITIGAMRLSSPPPGRTSASCSTPWSRGSTRRAPCRGRAAGTGGTRAPT